MLRMRLTPDHGLAPLGGDRRRAVGGTHADVAVGRRRRRVNAPTACQASSSWSSRPGGWRPDHPLTCSGLPAAPFVSCAAISICGQREHRSARQENDDTFDARAVKERGLECFAWKAFMPARERCALRKRWLGVRDYVRNC
jgi:hypothetical protein